MGKLSFLIMSIIILLVACNNDKLTNEPISEEKIIDNFILGAEVDKGIYDENSIMSINSYFEYTGEDEIKLEQKPVITIFIRNYDSGIIVEKIDFSEILTTMKKGSKFSHRVSGLNLKKGKYDLFVQTSTFSVDSSQYSLNTVPIIFEVK